MDTIKLYRTACGSDPEVKGETTLYYTEGTSQFARNLCSRFQDSSKELNAAHATLLLMYSAMDDRYIFAHIQAQEWTFENGARIYPFRGAYEVSSDDYTRYPLTSIVSLLPRIDHEGGRIGKVENEVQLEDESAVITDKEKNLASHIANAIQLGQYLYIYIPQKQLSDARGNKIFEEPRLQELLRSLDSLDSDLKSTATFSFLVDKNYSYELKESVVNVYAEGEITDFPDNTIRISWEEVVSTKCEDLVLQDYMVHVKEQDISPVLETNSARVGILRSIDTHTQGEHTDEEITVLEHDIDKYEFWNPTTVTAVWTMRKNAGKDSLEELLNMLRKNVNLTIEQTDGLKTSTIGKLLAPKDIEEKYCDWYTVRVEKLIEKEYTLNQCENWQEACQVKDHVLRKYMLQILASEEYVEKSADQVQEYMNHINQLAEAKDKKQYIRSTATFRKILLRNLESKDEKEAIKDLEKFIGKILHPHRKHYLQLTLAFLTGMAAGCGITLLITLLA